MLILKRWPVLFSLAAVAMSCLSCSAETPAPAPVPLAPQNDPLTESKSDSGSNELVATLAGGCFWCTEGVYEQFKDQGINDVESGYIGGAKNTAYYDAVKLGQTGHAETVNVYYDPDKIDYETILTIFFKSAHDPTQLNRQGADEGTQYRSSIFYRNEEQKKIASEFMANLKKEIGIVTLLEDGTGKTEESTFYFAEEYHQNYFRKHPGDGYCRAVALPKMKKALAQMKKIEAKRKKAKSSSDEH